MKSTLTHFEIYGPVPETLVEFYQNVFGWQVEEMPGLNYWRIQIGATETKPLHGGLTYSAIPDLNGFLLYVNVASMDETVAKILTMGGSIVRPKTAVPRTAWVTIVADPAKNIFGIWQPDPNAFPMPEPD
jgi:uncharacterized protein